jgi:hypothetical protein
MSVSCGITSHSVSELLCDWRFTANQFFLVTSPLRITTSNFIFQLNTCGYRPYVTFSLTKGLVCCLQLLLALASAVILRSESSGIYDHILLPQIRDSPNLEGQVPVFIAPGTGWAGYTPMHWVSSSPTTRRAEVEVFDPASRQNIKSQMTELIISIAVRTWDRTQWIIVI